MPKKDRDVWDPPEDRKMVKELPSAFMQHFQDRAVRVGKDGSNAQLVRVKKTKPIQWSDGNNRNKEGRGSIPGPLGDETSMHKRKPMMLKLPLRNRSHVRGIVAPDEPKAIMPPRRLQAINHTICVESGNGLGRHTRPFFDAHVVNRMDANDAPNPAMAISPDCRIENIRQTVAAATVMSPRLELSDVTSISVDKSQSPEVLSVECVDVSRPVKPIPFSRPLSDTMGLMDAGEGLRKSLARLPPRKISGSSGADEAPMMPRPKNTAVSPPLPLERNEKKKNKKEDRNDVLSREDEVDDFSVQFEDDNSEFRARDSTDIPIYQPVGFMMPPRPGAVKSENKTSIIAARKRNPSSGTRRPESENGPCGTRQDYHLCTLRKKGLSTGIQEFATSAPVRTTGINSHPSRLQPLSLPLPPRTSTVSATSSGALTETKESEQEEEKKKNPAYKSYNLKDYKLMMEQVTHLKLGGLGPADTDEQRQAKEKMHRQCQYGKLVEKKAVERIREKQQQRIIQKLKLGEGGDADFVLNGTPNKMPQQPPPPERIQAQERRSRALDYARNLPRPELPASRKMRDDNSISTLEPGTLQWRSQQDEATWRREQRLKELEARHRIDRERVAAVKRQLGY
ncbi:putative ADG2 [Trypanosoma cruzi]|uniref:ADG2, putative n=2 Tax=Trypanosoma cruzi TaxID=5693 RepID=Q4DIM9_TRYCC|nr:ADG2, putative [Trypanosoma cruzi]EAN92376.1 ADG2, putative [Trypanosoma cruzi]RNC61481.1 putative ADG2 [Trypanosoma cruzi]|eukprot:XP_814227.1 ADG2 [Trypanosoma cruzi strain CL Brener]